MRKPKLFKKGMEVGGLYQFVLLIVLVGMLLGVGILTLDKFGQSAGLTADSSTAINDTIDAIAPIATTWLPLIVTVSVLAIILTLVIRSFSGQGGR